MTKIPISIITGYLGSGKTTLLKNILKDADKKIAVVMNEFGEIAVDSKIIKGKNIEIAELSGGCVCCSISGEFGLAIKELIRKVRPELIILETTGVADPENLVDDIQTTLSDLVFLDAAITVVDADGFLKFPSIGHTGRVQIEMADIILLNKMDLVSESQADEIELKVKQINPKAYFFRTRNCEIDFHTIFGFNVGNKQTKGHKQHITESWFSYESKFRMVRSKFETFLKALPKEIFRAKGFVLLDEKSYLLQYVAGRYELEPFKTDLNQIVFIGNGADNVKDKILRVLEHCH